MQTPNNKSQSIKNNSQQSNELKTDGPLSEKDEVKAAERKTAKLLKTAAMPKKKGK